MRFQGRRAGASGGARVLQWLVLNDFFLHRLVGVQVTCAFSVLKDPIALYVDDNRPTDRFYPIESEYEKEHI